MKRKKNYILLLVVLLMLAIVAMGFQPAETYVIVENGFEFKVTCYVQYGEREPEIKRDIEAGRSTYISIYNPNSLGCGCGSATLIRFIIKDDRGYTVYLEESTYHGFSKKVEGGYYRIKASPHRSE